MVAFSLIGILCGLLLGLRFKVLAVVLAHALAVVLTVGCAWAAQGSVMSGIAALVCWSIGSQAGYLFAAALPRDARMPRGQAQKA